MNSIDRYLEVASLYPEKFRQSDFLHIITDKNELLAYSEKSNCKVGVIYESKYMIFVADLIKSCSGGTYTYSRIINPNSTNGVVIIAVSNDKFALLNQFRHGTRAFELEFPRGCSEPGISPEENAKKEILEEIGAKAISVCFEGSIISDSGLNGGTVDVYSIQIDCVRKLSHEEGIREVLWADINEIKTMIKENRIKDAFTISAISKYLINREGL